jgi:hypothetical protein
MPTMKNILFLLFVLVLLHSCTSGEHIHPGRQSQVLISDVITPVKIVEYDVDLNRKIEGVAEGYLSKYMNLEQYKVQAVSKACMAANVDLMIEPTFIVNTQGSKVSVKAVGYPAKYIEVRNAVPDDSIHVKFSRGPFQAPMKQKGQFKLIY